MPHESQTLFNSINDQHAVFAGVNVPLGYVMVSTKAAIEKKMFRLTQGHVGIGTAYRLVMIPSPKVPNSTLVMSCTLNLCINHEFSVHL